MLEIDNIYFNFLLVFAWRCFLSQASRAGSQWVGQLCLLSCSPCKTVFNWLITFHFPQILNAIPPDCEVTVGTQSWTEVNFSLHNSSFPAACRMSAVLRGRRYRTGPPGDHEGPMSRAPPEPHPPPSPSLTMVNRPTLTPPPHHFTTLTTGLSVSPSNFTFGQISIKLTYYFIITRCPSLSFAFRPNPKMYPRKITDYFDMMVVNDASILHSFWFARL